MSKSRKQFMLGLFSSRAGPIHFQPDWRVAYFCYFTVSFRWEEEYTVRMDLQQKIADLQEVMLFRQCVGKCGSISMSRYICLFISFDTWTFIWFHVCFQGLSTSKNRVFRTRKKLLLSLVISILLSVLWPLAINWFKKCIHHSYLKVVDMNRALGWVPCLSL